MASTDVELFSRPLRMQRKMVFVDVKKNAQGTYLKLKEKSATQGAGGPSSTILLPASGLVTMRDAIDAALGAARDDGAARRRRRRRRRRWRAQAQGRVAGRGAAEPPASARRRA